MPNPKTPSPLHDSLLEAAESAIIAFAMGWDTTKVMADLDKAVKSAKASAAIDPEKGSWEFAIGDEVEKFSGEVRCQGVIVGRFLTTKRKRRYVVEVMPHGFQMIAAPEVLRSSDARVDVKPKILVDTEEAAKWKAKYQKIVDDFKAFRKPLEPRKGRRPSGT